jgi:protein-S-isoprenylcysteine O-methyltransferase Ste14
MPLSVERKFWMRWRVRLGYPVAVLYWLAASPQPRWIAAGAVVASFGLLVRAMAAGHLRKSEELTTSGLYSRTRNPLYLGSAILATGFAIAGHSWLAGAIVAIYFGVSYYAVMRNEEEELRARWGHAFAEYAARVPLFLPRMFASHEQPSVDGTTTPPKERRPFSWPQYRRNREYQALIGTILALGFVWARMLVPPMQSFVRRLN